MFAPVIICFHFFIEYILYLIYNNIYRIYMYIYIYTSVFYLGAETKLGLLLGVRTYCFCFSCSQTEADPQVISLLMEREGYGKLASGLINVAGHRVTTDPLAIPFSMGRNLFW